jgi:molybdopterin-guanine dinucleotide biosynthesis protein A
MGTDKLSLEIGGMPLIRRVHAALAVRCEEILVVGGERVDLEYARRVAGERPGRQGPLAGIEAGLAAARNRHVFVAAGDMPFVSPSLVDYLLERLKRGDAGAVVPRHRGRTQPLCGAYDRDLLAAVGSALDEGVRSVRAFLERLDGVEYVGEELRRFGDPDLLLMNVNTPADLERAKGEAAR